MVTGSTDRTVKLWDLRGQGNERAGPRMLLSRDFGVGKVFTATFAPDKEVGFRVAVAGSEGSLRVWDVLSNSTVRHAFGGGGGGTLPRKREGGGEEEERVVGVADASEGSSSGSEDDGEEDGAGREQGGSMDTS